MVNSSPGRYARSPGRCSQPKAQGLAALITISRRQAPTDREEAILDRALRPRRPPPQRAGPRWTTMCWCGAGPDTGPRHGFPSSKITVGMVSSVVPARSSRPIAVMTSHRSAARSGSSLTTPRRAVTAKVDRATPARTGSPTAPTQPGHYHATPTQQQDDSPYPLQRHATSLEFSRLTQFRASPAPIGPRRASMPGPERPAEVGGIAKT